MYPGISREILKIVIIDDTIKKRLTSYKETLTLPRF